LPAAAQQEQQEQQDLPPQPSQQVHDMPRTGSVGVQQLEQQPQSPRHQPQEQEVQQQQQQPVKEASSQQQQQQQQQPPAQQAPEQQPAAAQPEPLESPGALAAAAASSFPVVVQEGDIPEAIKGLLSSHLEFLSATGELTVKDMMGPLREYAQVRRLSAQPAAARQCCCQQQTPCRGVNRPGSCHPTEGSCVPHQCTAAAMVLTALPAGACLMPQCLLHRTAVCACLLRLTAIHAACAPCAACALVSRCVLPGGSICCIPPVGAGLPHCLGHTCQAAADQSCQAHHRPAQQRVPPAPGHGQTQRSAGQCGLRSW